MPRRRPRPNPYASILTTLRDAINAGFDPDDFAFLVEEWFEDTGQRRPKGFDPDAPWEWVQKADPVTLKGFKGWLDDVPRHRVPPSERPIYDTFSGARLLPPSTWLVHFSDEAWGIAHDGFAKGQDEWEFRRLALTGSWKEPDGPGWNFAFQALGRDALVAAREFKYGEGAVLFQSAGVEAFHNGDEESQVMFLGRLVRRVVLLGYDKDSGEWYVYDRRIDRSLRSGTYEQVARWVIDHHVQYRKAIVREVQS
jgi:hypothetical protein